MITFYLVRHASYTEKYHLLPGRLPVELSETGVKEAEKLSRYFEDKNIEKIISSEVLRCKQTAEIISNGKIPVEFDKRLLEVHSAYQGYWVEDAWDHFWGHLDELGGENMEKVTKRVMDFLDNYAFEDGKNYIICSHGDPVYLIYQKASGAPPLPVFTLGQEVVDPPDYPKRGSVKIVTENNGNYKYEKTINQEDLQ